MTTTDDVRPALRETTTSPAPATPGGGHRGVTVLFAVTGFLGAFLLFLVEPLVAKLLLPSFGGSATVWSTSSLFFQILLLVAYGYCHLSTRFLARWQPKTHLLVLLAPLLALPLALPADAAPAADGLPALWLLRTLAVMIGLPFVVVATTGPLLQKWYSWTRGRGADDPYFLFAASNLGSFVGLLAYPFVVESRLTLVDQRTWWSWAYGGFVVLTACCAVHAARQSPATVTTVAMERSPLGRARIVRWLLLAFLPSTLLLGATSHLSTDVASIPLLWVVPLAVYLATFVLAFARRSRTPARHAIRAAVALGVVEVLLCLRGPVPPIAIGVAGSMLMLGLVAYSAHSQLAIDRPSPEHLTTFYLVIAAGGALGGLLNGLVAPSVFPAVWEYPLALLAVPLLLLGLTPPQAGRVAALLLDNHIRIACVGLAAGILLLGLRWVVTRPGGSLPVTVLFVLVAVAVGWSLTRSAVLALVVVVALTASGAVMGTHGRLHEARSFYGTYRVLDNDSGQHVLVHGTTVHGTEYTDPARRNLPTTYYSRTGPLGDVFDRLGGGLDQVGVVGLGAGTVASYGEPGQRLTFFEIDPEVVRIARDERYFHYLADSRADVTTVTGDGRLNLALEPRSTYDLLVLDAFSSDAIPVHLMTEEAVALYVSRLRPGGVLMFHISNRVFDLKPVLSAAAARLHLHAVVGTSNSHEQGATPTQWVAMSPDAAPIERLRTGPLWSPLETDRQVAWTDDYSSVLSVLRWGS